MSVRLTPIIIFVRRFERCLEFYREVFDLTPVRIYRGKEHPPWAEFQVGDIRLALHGGYRGVQHEQGRPVALHFEVKDIRKTVEKINRYGGQVKEPPRKLDFRPVELMIVYDATFADPDGNEFEVQQLLEEFSE
ncbi:MAG: VOC family protein [Candidatus Geothermarchaeales archaeon]